MICVPETTSNKNNVIQMLLIILNVTNALLSIFNSMYIYLSKKTETSWTLYNVVVHVI
jgi:hypothetical protein